jgi:hypothetical protein
MQKLRTRRAQLTTISGAGLLASVGLMLANLGDIFQYRLGLACVILTAGVLVACRCYLSDRMLERARQDGYDDGYQDGLGARRQETFSVVSSDSPFTFGGAAQKLS